MALCALIVALSVCGRDGDRQSVRAVVDGFYAAVRDHHGERACALLSPDTRKALQGGVPSVYVSSSRDDGRTRRVKVFSTDATVELAGGDTVFLGDSPSGWQISAAGCHLQKDKPAECEVQD